MSLKQLLKCRHTVLPNLLSKNQVNNILYPQPKNPVIYEKNLSKRRSIYEWKGVSNIDRFPTVTLPDGRVDVSLPKNLGEVLTIQASEMWNIFFYLNEVTDRSGTKPLKIASYNLLINPPNENMQMWHQDYRTCDEKDYYTILIPLNEADGMGKTEIKNTNGQPFIPDVQVGDALVFSGSLTHRGTPNLSNKIRYCLYMVMTRLEKEKLFENWY